MPITKTGYAQVNLNTDHFESDNGVITLSEVPAVKLSGTINSARLPDLAPSDFGAGAKVERSAADIGRAAGGN